MRFGGGFVFGRRRCKIADSPRGDSLAPPPIDPKDAAAPMKAIRFELFGDPAEVLRVVDLPTPEPGANEVRVRMIASPINPSDLLTIRGKYGVMPSLPFIPGYEGVGVVDKAGPGLIGKFLVGRRVAVLSQTGGNWAEYTVVPALRVVPVPQGSSRRAGGVVLRQPGHGAGDGPPRPPGPARGPGSSSRRQAPLSAG